MKYSVCIDMMLQSYPFLERLDAVKKTGINTVEFWKWTNKDIDALSRKLQQNNMNVSVFNIDSSDSDLSYRLSRGVLNAGDVDGFIKGFNESAPVYHKLNACAMIVLIGETIENLSYEQQIENIKKCLKAVAPLAEAQNINLVAEPLSATDRKNYFMPFSKPLFEILKEVNSPNIKMLFDIYHQQMTEGGLIDKIEKNIDLIGHFHVADCPGRHEPGTGEINYPNVLKAIAETGYSEYVGFEYRPTKNDEETLVENNV